MYVYIYIYIYIYIHLYMFIYVYVYTLLIQRVKSCATAGGGLAGTCSPGLPAAAGATPPWPVYRGTCHCIDSACF